MANQSCGIGCSFQLGCGSSSAGVFVLKVREGGPAASVGICPGDRLLGFFLDSKVRVASIF
jgi:predicted metalloprotease with PDZ domain